MLMDIDLENEDEVLDVRVKEEVIPIGISLGKYSSGVRKVTTLLGSQ